MSKLSPFHQEIVGFLHAEARKRAGDVELKDFEMLPLGEIVERYGHLFGEGGFSRVECDWMDSFSEKEFEELGLGKYFPRIYRGLPRVYARDNAMRSQIKSNFTGLADLRRLSVDRAVFSLYEGQSKKRKARIGIFCWVMNDGLGDWVAAQEAAHCLREKMPWLEILLFPISDRTLEPIYDFPVHRELGLLGEMDFVLQIPTFYGEGVSAHESIGEYGYLESSWFHPKSGNRSMGLHALEKGIFIRTLHHRPSFAEVKQKELLRCLFGTEIPGPIEIEAYERSHRFHVGYLATPMGGSIYLHSLLKLYEWDGLDIDVCCPDLAWFIQWIEDRKKSGLPILQELFGVKEIVVQLFDQTHRVPVAEKGKVLRLISPGPISHADMQHLIALSGDWVGVRGNQTLSEAISAGKPFFYDGRDHARYLIKDLVAMAENRLSGYRSALHAFRMMSHAFLWNLPDETGDWVDESYFQRDGKLPWFEIAKELGGSLQDPDAIAGYKKYCRICAEEKAFNPFLCHLVERALCSPAIRQAEKELVDLYAAGKISLTTLVKNLRLRMMQE